MADEFDFIVVGSGAGGGPLAARLAEHNFRVALLEAGGDTSTEDPNYAVPVFYPQACCADNMRWDYFVRTYADTAQQSRNKKYKEDKHGVLYPRAGTLGGCTAHNALITIYPHNQDWEKLAEDLQDDSWRASSMRGYFEQVEKCDYRVRTAQNRHGSGGWLHTNIADPRLILGDTQLFRVIFVGYLQSILEQARHENSAMTPRETVDFAVNLLRRAFARTIAEPLLDLFREAFTSTLAESEECECNLWKKTPEIRRLIDALRGVIANSQVLQADLMNVFRQLDPNDYQFNDANIFGRGPIPLAINAGRRNSTVERVKQVKAERPDNLFVITNALAKKIQFEGRRAVGIEYLEGARLYHAADKGSMGVAGATRTLKARKEIILSCGTFNTPQLLMLSGIGDRDRLAAHIRLVQHSPGVGKNLHDRYEITVVSEFEQAFQVLGQRGRDDFVHPHGPLFDQWRRDRTGIYATNGAALGIMRRSQSTETKDGPPDLFIFGVPGTFAGYFPQWGPAVLGEPSFLRPDGEAAGHVPAEYRNRFTWAILKGHTRNRGGTVQLRSGDPRDTPVINFNYFPAGRESELDLNALAEGVEFVRRIAHNTPGFRREIYPGPDVKTRADIKQYVKDQSWGHHACGTCKIGRRDEEEAVVDKDFRVKGVDGLRVVDASIFRDIPGFFIVSAVYMISEKAADVILKEHR